MKECRVCSDLYACPGVAAVKECRVCSDLYA